VHLDARVHRLGRLPLPLELPPRVREAAGERERDVVVARYDEHGRAEAAQEVGRCVVLVPAAAVGEVAARDHELGVDTFHQLRDRPRNLRLVERSARPEMQIRDVKDAC